MAVNKLRLCRVFRFLAELFYSGHAFSFFGLLHTVPDEDMETIFLIQREESEYCLKPTLPYLVQGPGGTEEMNQGQIRVRFRGQITDRGSNTKFIRRKHQTNGKNCKPAKCSLSQDNSFRWFVSFLSIGNLKIPQIAMKGLFFFYKTFTVQYV